jgi:2-keto-4-pentenoate hydratase/2-oxohepta-3-ene-1,7-dioic acid hydratase in catechol pathway
MKLATGLLDGTPRLLTDVGGEWIDVAASAPSLAGVHDAGGLLRAGRDAIETVRGLTGGVTVDPEAVRFAPPVLAPSKIICIGLNYRRHAAEGGVPVPAQPIVFAKYPNTLVGSGAAIVDSPLTRELDYEAELAVVIGTRARGVPAERALEVVGGYANANDVSARDLQHAHEGSQWVHGKTLDTFCPMGPYLVTPDEAGPWQDIRVRGWVNGELRQDEQCRDMVFGVEELIEYLSAGITLEPGDVILTGTPSGVGLGFSPPKWLAPGDVVEVELSGLGRLRSPVVAAPAA